MKIRLFLFSLALLMTAARAETVFLVGDSTVADYKLPDPRNGWGQVIGQFFTADVAVKNFAISGRSSKSFLEEGAWEPVLAQIQPGDYVFVQFGHNDEKMDAARHTDPYGNYQEFLTRYVVDTLKVGGIPVLVTPVARGGLKKSSGPGSHGRYPEAMIELAKDKQVMWIDLTTLSENMIRKLSFREVTPLYIASIDGKDDTHFTPAGALVIAKIVAQAIKALDTPLAAKVKFGE
jgi:lysophospholipase L1-like esterase